MKFTSALLFASAVTAAQLDHHRREPGTKPRALTRRSQPRISTKGPTNSTKAQYSQNWAGAVIVTTGVTAVTGTITVPSVSAGHSGGATKSCASAWIGIDGATCVSAILQMGVDFCFENGQASYSAWYEWYPDYSYNFDDMIVSEGDVITMTATATSGTAGAALLENHTTGQSVTQTFNGNVLGSLCRTNAEWIIEDFQENSSLVPFANFSTLAFSNATATAGGATVNPSRGIIIDIRQSGTILTSCSTSSNKVTCKYV